MDGIILEFINILSPSQVLTGDELISRYEHIWTMGQSLKAKAVLLPTSTEEVSNILKFCYENDQVAIIHGGLTNLVGGTTTSSNQVVISTEKLNKIIEIDSQSRTMTVQAGVVLQNIQQRAQEQDLLFPLNFGAKGSAQIGGVIATNAGGLRVLKYGMTRNLILGLEVVLADGTILSGLKKIIKDNSGYDLKQLFIGSEGTLGVVTKAVLKLTEAPRSRNSAWVGINGYENVVKFLKYIDSCLAGTLTAFELVWKDTFKTLTSAPSPVSSPLPYDYEYYVLVENLGSNQEKDRALLEQILEESMEAEIIQDAVLAYSSTDLEWFWQIREDVHILSSQANNDQHFDISIPIPMIGQLIEKTRDELLQIVAIEKVFLLGHVADGNIHLIIGKENNSLELTQQINDIVYVQIKSIHGSVSAEHGIGLDKKAYLSMSRSKEEIDLMKLLKKTLDPKNILNPGRIFDL